MFIILKEKPEMNVKDWELLILLNEDPAQSQRTLSSRIGCSLGSVNKMLKALMEERLIEKDHTLTSKAKEGLKETSPAHAIILAAGTGLRMVPIHTESPKALLEVQGEPLIEHQIRYLKQAGITDITIVVGYQKEKFEYLIDQEGVLLKTNADFISKGNLHSLALAVDKLENTYIIPSDLWFASNPFRKTEAFSWYSMLLPESVFDRKPIKALQAPKSSYSKYDKEHSGFLGLSYITKEDAQTLKKNLQALENSPDYENAFWEEALYSPSPVSIQKKYYLASEVKEINTFEDLRDLDDSSQNLKSDVMDVICDVFQIPLQKIRNVSTLKKGMTNRSFLFTVGEQKYIMRVPGEGTNKLINRAQEYQTYQLIKDLNLCDPLIYINPENGYKITRYINNSRVCDPDDVEDLQKCMKLLKSFHAKKLQSDYEFDIFAQIDYYQSLWPKNSSLYRDYETVKNRVLELRPYLDQFQSEKCLTHIDAVPDNFLIYTDENNQERIRLIDWEYSAMQDPHVDIAMFCIYAMYEKPQVDRLIDIYFDHQTDEKIQTKIYAYIAVCGLLWSNWCEYKHTLGVEFGDYSLAQYRYAKEYSKLALKRMEQINE